MVDPESRQLIAMMVARDAGLHFQASHLSDLDRGINKTAEELKFSDIKSFIKELLESQNNDLLFETLVNHLTIGETYFFREKPLLEVFRTQVIPELQKRADTGGQPLTIWSAGCCSGEEPYTLAIILNECGYRQGKLKSKVIATDINRKFIEKAIQGEYSSWSFRETPPDFRKKYFSQADRVVSIQKQIRDMVSFSRFNLIAGNPAIHGLFPESVHVIFCRNVLMYFTPENVEKTYQMFYETLVPEGYLFLSPVEVPMNPPKGFRLVKVGEVMLLQKLLPGTEIENKWHPAHHHLHLKANLTGIHDHPVKIQTEHDRKKPSLMVTSSDRQNVPSSAEGYKHGHSTADKEVNNDRHEFALATRSYERKSYHATIRHIGKISSAAIGRDHLTLLIRSHANLGELDQALKYCTKLLESEPTEPKGYYLQASVFMEMKHLEKAEEFFRKALYLDPGFIMAHFSLAMLYRRNGRENNAARHLSNVLHLLQDIPEEHVVNCADGMTAGRIKEMTEQMLKI